METGGELRFLTYLNKEDEREVETGDYRGGLYTRREYSTIGSYGGIVFYAEFETIKGKDKMKFLVSEQTPGKRFSFSLS